MGKRTERSQTRFISDESQIPPGYVPMANYTPGTRLHRAMCDAHRTGQVRAVKLVRHEGDVTTGPVWVDADDAQAFEQAFHANATRVRQKAAQPVADERFWTLAKTCVDIRDLLERIADAVERNNARPTDAG